MRNCFLELLEGPTTRRNCGAWSGRNFGTDWDAHYNRAGKFEIEELFCGIRVYGSWTRTEFTAILFWVLSHIDRNVSYDVKPFFNIE